MRRNLPDRCAACNLSFGMEARRFAAHIWALEDGGFTTRDNVVFLCHTCHTLFDSGYSSRLEMMTCAANWRAGRSQPIREMMEKRRASSYSRQQSIRPAVTQSAMLQSIGVYDLVQEGKYRKALNALRELQIGGQCQADLIKIVMAQIHRRRAARGVLPMARLLLDSVCVDSLPEERLPLFYYEYAYVHQLEGNHEKAGQFFAKSARCADNLNDDHSKLESVIARAQELADLVIGLPAEGDTTVVEHAVQSLNVLADDAAKLSGTFAGRWVLNCLLWKVCLLLKIGECKTACYSYKEAIDFRDRLDVTSGWTRLTGITVCGIEGLTAMRTAANVNQVRDALRLLARALVPLLSGNRQRPERIRDFLLGFEEGLALLDTPRTLAAAAKIGGVRNKILDGSSFLDPYRQAG